ncbi:MAG: glutathione binding-like protein [Cyanobacteria bacterium P01_G01_bin.4]
MSNPDIHLYTAATMNGWKPVIFLEEAEIEYGLAYIDFGKKEQKSDWYLAEKYQKFLPKGDKQRSQALQWLMFQMSGVGPMMGQAMYFQRIAAPKGHEDAYAIDRYVNESRRLLEVLDKQLADRTYILGDDFTIVDMAMYPWARSYPWARVSVEGLDNLNAWFDRIDARPATQKAITIPKPFPAFFGTGDESKSEAENASRF